MESLTTKVNGKSPILFMYTIKKTLPKLKASIIKPINFGSVFFIRYRTI